MSDILSRMIHDQLTTAWVNGDTVDVDQAHRRWVAADYTTEAGAPGAPPEPVAVTVAAPVVLSLEDVAVVLFDWNTSVEELADDAAARFRVAYTVINEGCRRIEELRCTLGETEPTLDPLAASYLAYCRARAIAVFGASGASLGGSRDGVVSVGVR